MKMVNLAGTMMLEVRVAVKDKDGVIVKEIPWRRSHSFVRQFLDFMYCAFIDDSNVSILSTNGEAQNVSGPDMAQYTFLDLSGLANDDACGLVVGRSDDAEENEQFSLGQRILDGSGLNQLDYGVNQFGDSWVSGSSVYWNIWRVFTNLSGATVTIKEIALYCQANDTTTYSFMIARDLLEVIITNGNTATIEYRFQTIV